MSVPVVQTHQLVKVFKDFWLRPKAKAINDVSFTIEPGQVFGLLGPNGSGKSTTIKILLGLLFPTSGYATVFGRSPTDVEVKRRIGFLPEESYLYPYLNAREILDFYARLFGLDVMERKKRVDALVDMTGLGSSAQRLVGEYSKGMARRIGIAQALINDPDFIILDEPTTGLDPIGTREIKDLILTLKAKGKTVLLCSHLLADVEDVCDRVAIMYGGQIQVEGETASILQESNRFQITADMDEDTAADVVTLIRKHLGPDASVVLQPPMQRLENVFLRVVEDARRRDVETSGVHAANTHLTFLTDAEKDVEAEDLLARLVAPKAAPGAESASASGASDSSATDEGRSEAAPDTSGLAVLSRLAAPDREATADAEHDDSASASPSGAERSSTPASSTKAAQDGDVDTDLLKRLSGRE